MGSNPAKSQELRAFPRNVSQKSSPHTLASHTESKRCWMGTDLRRPPHGGKRFLKRPEKATTGQLESFSSPQGT